MQKKKHRQEPVKQNRTQIFPSRASLCQSCKLHKICNTDICWHTNSVLIPACLFCGNIFSRVHSAMSAWPTLLQWHAATPGHSPTSWQSCPVRSLWDNLPVGHWKIQSRLWVAYSLCTIWTAGSVFLQSPLTVGPLFSAWVCFLWRFHLCKHSFVATTLSCDMLHSGERLQESLLSWKASASPRARKSETRLLVKLLLLLLPLDVKS